MSTPITSLTAARKASSKTKERSLAKLSAALAWMTSSSWRGLTPRSSARPGAGVANFFIPRANLERLDFSQVLYNWDCC